MERFTLNTPPLFRGVDKFRIKLRRGERPDAGGIGIRAPRGSRR
jgi:hypothetical protein